jgi:hypothetical protein
MCLGVEWREHEGAVVKGVVGWYFSYQLRTVMDFFVSTP